MSKNNLGLVEHCKKALDENWGYGLGTIGRVMTEDILREISTRLNLSSDFVNYIKNNYMGKRTVDCASLIKSYLWWDDGNVKYDSSIDISADTMFYIAKVKGSIDTIPEIPGLIVYKKGHVGVYIGNGKVIEARGTKYGVVETDLNDRGWTDWFKSTFVEYAEVEKELNWKQQIVKEAFDSGLLKSDEWIEKAEDKADIWFVCAMLINLEKKLSE